MGDDAGAGRLVEWDEEKVGKRPMFSREAILAVVGDARQRDWLST